MSEPTTAAGRLYVAWQESSAADQAMATRFGRDWDPKDVVVAIEAEAVADELARIRTAVEGIHPDGEPCVCVAAVLDILGEQDAAYIVRRPDGSVDRRASLARIEGEPT